MKCQCCGNEVQAMYWLIGKNYVWDVCYVCWSKPYLKALFLNQKGDLTNKLIKQFGLSLGYTRQEIKVSNMKGAKSKWIKI